MVGAERDARPATMNARKASSTKETNEQGLGLPAGERKGSWLAGVLCPQEAHASPGAEDVVVVSPGPGCLRVSVVSF